jgi:very-short-patch-repair endonuclease
VNRFYPAIFYPPLILKFLAKNPAPSLSAYHLLSTRKLEQLLKHQGSYTSILPKVSLLHVSIYVLFISIGFLISLSFILLSPLWLVAATWVSVGLGIFCAMFPVSPKTSGNKNISKYRQSPTEVKNETVLRLQKREAKLRQWIADKVLQPIGRSEAPAGVSEKAFYQVLRHVFPNAVQGVAFQNPQFSYPYSADFVFVHTSSLSIDIEIDEPYVGNTKAPHHCIDQGKDEIRNKFFTNGNWVVIRFSEKQVVKYPRSCCKVIASVVARVAGDRTYLFQLQSVPDLPHEPMWTIKQAKKWANVDYRKTYLPVFYG